MAYSYCHGGDIETFVSEFGAQPIDLSANINPFGVPEAVRAAMHRAVDECAHYPDPFCRARQAVAEAEGFRRTWFTAETARRMCSTGSRQCSGRSVCCSQRRPSRNTKERSQARKSTFICSARARILRSRSGCSLIFRLNMMRSICAIPTIRPDARRNRN